MTLYTSAYNKLYIINSLVQNYEKLTSFFCALAFVMQLDWPYIFYNNLSIIKSRALTVKYFLYDKNGFSLRLNIIQYRKTLFVLRK